MQYSSNIAAFGVIFPAVVFFPPRSTRHRSRVHLFGIFMEGSPHDACWQPACSFLAECAAKKLFDAVSFSAQKRAVAPFSCHEGHEGGIA